MTDPDRKDRGVARRTATGKTVVYSADEQREAIESITSQIRSGMPLRTVIDRWLGAGKSPLLAVRGFQEALDISHGEAKGYVLGERLLTETEIVGRIVARSDTNDLTGSFGEVGVLTVPRTKTYHRGDLIPLGSFRGLAGPTCAALDEELSPSNEVHGTSWAIRRLSEIPAWRGPCDQCDPPPFRDEVEE